MSTSHSQSTHHSPGLPPDSKSQNEPIIETKSFVAFLKDRSADHSMKTLGIFVRELGEKAVSLERIIAEHDLNALQKLAHSSVGSGSLLGAARLVGISRAIGNCCRRCEPIDWSIADELLRTVEETSRAINTVRNRESIEAIISWQKLALATSIARSEIMHGSG